MSRALAVALAVALVPLAVLIARFDFVCDDAYIAFRYARNLAEGHGLRYNPGVEPPVEGFTQLGWVLWMALAEWLERDVLLWSRASGISCAVVLLALTLRTATAGLRLALPGALACGLFFATLPTVGVWATGGLGTMAFALAVFASFDRLLGRPGAPRAVQAGLCGALTGAMRADGAYWLAALFAVALVQALARRDGGLRRAALVFGGCCAASVAACTLWRWSVFGDWLPNTARAKVGLSARSLERGSYYLMTFWLAMPATLVALSATLGLAARGLAAGAPGLPRERAWLLAGCAALAAATCLYGVLIGGDFMAMGRFFLPSVPFLALGFGAAFEALWRRGPRAVSVVTAGLAALLLAGSLASAWDVHAVPESWRARFHFRWNRREYKSEVAAWESAVRNAERWTLLGRALGRSTRPGQSLVRGPIGAVGYYSRLFVFDRHGLVDREVAAMDMTGEPLRTPGQDRVAPAEFFARRQPTFRDAFLAPRGAPLPAGVPPAAVRRVPLPPAEGFPPGRELVLVRMDARD